MSTTYRDELCAVIAKLRRQDGTFDAAFRARGASKEAELPAKKRGDHRIQVSDEDLQRLIDEYLD